MEFFSNHPSPDNRIERVTQEVNALGGEPRRADVNARAFDETTRYLQSVPAPKGQPAQVAASRATGLRIVSASYGASNRFIDVRERMQSRVANDRLDLVVDSSSMGGDPVSQAKALHMRYEWDDRAYDVSVQEGSRLSIPSVQQVRDTNVGANANVVGPDRPSERFVGFENSLLRISHPDNWQARGQGDAMTIAPRGGLIDDGQGRQALAYGVIVSIFEPSRDSYGQSLQGRGYGQPAGQPSTTRLEQSTDQLVQELRQSNRNMRVTRNRDAVVVDGDRALSTHLSNDSPTGDRETDWLVTVERPEGLLFLVFTAPERAFPAYEGTFQQMLRSIRIKR